LRQPLVCHADFHPVPRTDFYLVPRGDFHSVSRTDFHLVPCGGFHPDLPPAPATSTADRMVGIHPSGSSNWFKSHPNPAQ
jgi:hypothetical protein